MLQLLLQLYVFRNAYFLQPLFCRLYAVAVLVTLKPELRLTLKYLLLFFFFYYGTNIHINTRQFLNIGIYIHLRNLSRQRKSYSPKPTWQSPKPYYP